MLLRSNDYIFYPLMLAAAALMIGLPLIPAAQDRIQAAEAIRENGIVINGDRLRDLVIAEGLEAEVLRGADNRLFARITATGDRNSPLTPASAGAFDALRPYELEAIAGHDLIVTAVIGPPAELAAATFDLGVFQDGIGQNGWTPQTMGESRQDYVLQVDVPYCNPSYSFVGFWPSAASRGNSIDVHEIRVRAGAPADCVERAE